MRIVHAVRSDGFAGVERHVSRLAAGQRAAGHDVTVIGGDPGAMAGAVGRPDVRLVPAADTVWSVAAALRTYGPGADVLHAHMTAAELAAAFARLTGARLPPVVTTRHFGAPRGSGVLGRPVAAVARRTVRAQIAISRYVAANVDGPATVVYPGVPLPDAVPAAAARSRRVLVVQRLEPEKFTDVAVAAFAASGLAGDGWELVVAGAGSLRPALETQAKALGLAAVRFLGHVADVDPLMDDAAVLVAPTPGEGLGLSVLEALSHGLPVVAAGSGGYAETLADLAPDALFPPGDAAAAGAALRRLALDEAARARYAEDARERVRERFTVDAQVASTDSVYRRVLRPPAPREAR
ncbi:MAG TPA: glycosyltransferase family 4 protein [Cellulomonas sp.]